jgi:hypothetical protein
MSWDIAERKLEVLRNHWLWTSFCLLSAALSACAASVLAEPLPDSKFRGQSGASLAGNPRSDWHRRISRDVNQSVLPDKIWRVVDNAVIAREAR